ncbi:hypothetical protein SAMN04488522_101795 [Pedobacter caeni]|uniref:Uncharacterized protein n=1 Tax=Pedobacter caeni TaxID=288992 RepID=A0A1M4V6N0_9SPHI|nr:hypothetical protein SAMN04488522_101795 [Pedobacter caeni]
MTNSDAIRIGTIEDIIYIGRLLNHFIKNSISAVKEGCQTSLDSD